MSRARPASSGVHRHLLVAVVLGISLGILGMHALVTHSATGGEGHHAMTMTVGQAAATSPTSADPHADGAVSATSATRTAGGAGAPGGEALATATQEAGQGRVLAADPATPGHDMDEMTMLCVFMVLAAAGLVLLASRVLRRVPATSCSSAREVSDTASRQPVDAGTGAGPPPVWAFSVIRC